MEKKKILSISLLVSNRPDTVEKCLKSLEHLRTSVPSELILVDTGCGEKVREIIEPYADKIVEFPWCGDFAKARNAGLKEATGEWFLYLDDDEWFDDTSEIEEFFLSGEWKKYGYGLYVVRNYSDFSGKKYDDVLVTRMVKLGENTKFVYSIHESFNYLEGNVKKFHAFVHHYGYAYKTKKDLLLHSQRNIIPLLEEHRRNPRELRHNAQLAQEYNATGEYRKSIEISLEGIKYPSKDFRHINSLFANIVNCYFQLFDYKKTLEYGHRYLRDDRTNDLCKATIYSILCKANYELEKYKETLRDLEWYFNAYQKQLQDENCYLFFSGLFLDCFDKLEVNYNIGFGIRAALALDDIEKAKHYFYKIDFTGKALFIDRNAIDKIIEKYIQKSDDQYFDMMSVMIQNKNLMHVIIDVIEEKRKNNPDIFQKTSEKWEKFKSDHWYFKYLMHWTASQNIEKEEYQEIWDYPEYALPKSIDYGIWDMVDSPECIREVLCNIPFYRWQKAVESVFRMIVWTEIQKINEKIQQIDTKSNNKVWWEICFQERSFREMDGTKTLTDIDMKHIRHLWKEYAKKSLELFSRIYRNDLFEERSSILPECCQISFLLQDFFKEEEEKEYLAQVNILKEIKECSSDFSIPVKYYLKYVQEQIELQEAEQKNAQMELQWMARQILPKIEEMVQMNRKTEALAAVQQIRQLLPDDTEVAEIENKLRDSLKS